MGDVPGSIQQCSGPKRRELALRVSEDFCDRWGSTLFTVATDVWEHM